MSCGCKERREKIEQMAKKAKDRMDLFMNKIKQKANDNGQRNNPVGNHPADAGSN